MKLHEDGAQKLMSPTPTILPTPPPPQPAPMASWGVPYNQLMEEEKNWPDLQMVLHYMQVPPKSGQL